MKWSIGRNPPQGIAMADDLRAAVEQIKNMARTSGLGGPGGRKLKIWPRESRDATDIPRGILLPYEGGRFIVGPCEQVGDGGILAITIAEAEIFRAQACKEMAWPESNEIVIWRENTKDLVYERAGRKN